MREDDVVDATIERMALALRRPVDLGPEVDRAVMAAIRAAPLMVAGTPTPRPRGAWSWLVRPRSVRFSVSPIGALAAAGIAIVAALFGLRRDSAADQRLAERLRATGELPTATGEFAVPTATAPGAAVAAAAAVHDTVFVTRFIIPAPDAKQVALVGDFNGWDQQKTRLTPVKSGGGLWAVEVPLASGVYSYAFLIDGKEWKADPRATPAADDFGRPSSTITVSREGMTT